MDLTKEVEETLDDLILLKNENKRLITKIQEQNSNINILTSKIKQLNSDIKSYKRLYENEKREKLHFMKFINEKQEQLEI